ncbi:MAG: hypothetical protein HXS44_00750 [Theionarchaea archaeon]|nr:hypothetical protein [Theionarchaea archaeon]
MKKETILKIAATILLIHGIIEISAVLMPFAPAEFLDDFQESLGFWAVLSIVYGLSRVVSSYSVWSMKKWGIALGVALSVTTLIVAPSIYPFGAVDLPLAVIVLICLLYAWFGNEKL